MQLHTKQDNVLEFDCKNCQIEPIFGFGFEKI